MRKNICSFNFKEKRLVYQEAPAGAWEAIKEAAATGTTAIAKTLESLANLTTKSIDYLGVGAVKVEGLMGKVKETLIDPKTPDFSSDLYDVGFIKLWNVNTDTLNNDLNFVIDLHARIAFLKYRLKEIEELNRPAIEALKKAQAILEMVNNRNFELKRSKIIKQSKDSEISKKIQLKKEILNDFPATSSDYMRIKTEIAALESQKLQLDKLTSYEVLWEEPYFVQVEFPSGSGEYVERLSFDNLSKKKVKVNVNELCDFLESTIEGSIAKAIDLDRYEDELKSLTFYREKHFAELSQGDKSIFVNDFKGAIEDIFKSGEMVMASELRVKELTGAREKVLLLNYLPETGKQVLKKRNPQVIEKRHPLLEFVDPDNRVGPANPPKDIFDDLPN